MTTNAQIGLGLKFSVEDAAGSGTFIDAVEVTDMTPPGRKLSAVDATHMQSPSATMEYIAGLLDEGSCQFSLNHAPGSATDTLFRAWQAAREKRACKITYGNTKVLSFSALPTDYSVASISPGGLIKASLTTQLSGPSTLA